MVHEGIHWWTDYTTVTDFDLFSNGICPILLNSDALPISYFHVLLGPIFWSNIYYDYDYDNAVYLNHYYKTY